MHRHDRGGTLLGVFIGLVLGIALAAAVALYVTGGWKAYRQLAAGGESREAAQPQKSAKAEAEKPRFDFYKILPGGEEQKAQAGKPAPPDRVTVDKAAGKAAPEKSAEPAPQVSAADPAARAPKAPDRFWLQAGSFAAEPDADNLKARLALAGWEAQVQKGEVPDKGTRYRVRLGPYDNTDELNRVKGELARRGFDVAVIRY
ncbi:MAG: SPOR domain-containing protein [Betaproteobacteria bacterium]|jgi:cell division protein FtsN|nr:SPOR domain-containing protein [Betaproteobacteria bacterium]MDH5287267.1 SPOR domain-containing protein [Betaproteobacteria bacterium]